MVLERTGDAADGIGHGEGCEEADGGCIAVFGTDGGDLGVGDGVVLPGHLASNGECSAIESGEAGRVAAGGERLAFLGGQRGERRPARRGREVVGGGDGEAAALERGRGHPWPAGGGEEGLELVAEVRDGFEVAEERGREGAGLHGDILAI